MLTKLTHTLLPLPRICVPSYGPGLFIHSKAAAGAQQPLTPKVKPRLFQKRF